MFLFSLFFCYFDKVPFSAFDEDTGSQFFIGPGLFKICHFLIIHSYASLLNIPAGCPFAPRCKYCMKACLTKMPPESTVEEGHTVACWLPVKELMEEETDE